MFSNMSCRAHNGQPENRIRENLILSWYSLSWTTHSRNDRSSDSIYRYH